MKTFKEYLEIIQEGKVQNYKSFIHDPSSKSGRNKSAEKMDRKSIISSYGSKNGKYAYIIDDVQQNEMKKPMEIFDHVLELRNKDISVKIWDFSETDFSKIIKSISESNLERIEKIYDSVSGGYFSFIVKRTS